jgi:hypothetical protein
MVPFPVCRPPRYDVRAFPSQFAEMGGEVFGQSQALPDLFRVDVMQRPTAQREFVAQPQRWKIERTFGWLDWFVVSSARSMNEPPNRAKAKSILLRFD